MQFVRSSPLLLLVFAILASCGEPTSQAYYAVSASGDVPLPNMQGIISFADGEPVAANGQVLGASTTRLLTFIFLTPGLKGNNSEGGAFEFGHASATMELANGAGKDRVVTRVDWNKKIDFLQIEDSAFDRKNGSLFVIVKRNTSRAEVWQLASPPGVTRQEFLLSHAKKMLPQIEALQAATLNP